MSARPQQLAIVTGKLAPDLSDGGKQLATDTVVRDYFWSWVAISGVRGVSNPNSDSPAVKNHARPYELAEHGIDSEPVMWNDSSVNWSAFDAVLVRSCWDYPDDREWFQAMLRELEAAPVQVCNPLRVIQWNLHKSYLTTLADAGITIPDTTVIDQGADVSLESLFETQNWEELVVKPAIGAMSSQVWKTATSDLPESESKFAEQVSEHDVLVQEFIPEIQTGERSMVFRDDGLTHPCRPPIISNYRVSVCSVSEKQFRSE